ACSLLLSQLKEITGIHNPQFLQAALKVPQNEAPPNPADFQAPLPSGGPDFSTGKTDFAAATNAYVTQDVSEFTHKLLDWLEDAFQLTVEAE
ncbi:hypothetical protein E2320_007229, partial [Naja naja]